MAKTKNGFIYPDDYSANADIPSAMKTMAESIDVVVEGNIEKTKNNTEKIEESELIINSLIQENTSLKNQIPVGSAEGESITIDDSSDLPIKNVQLGGKMSQDTREGYNKLPIKFANATNNGITLTVKDNGKLILNGTSTSTALFTVVLDNEIRLENYVFKIKKNSGTISANSVQFFLYTTGYTSNQNIAVTSIATSAKTTLSSNAYTIERIVIPAETTLTDVELEVMISETEKDYEQYGAMPSIEYPSPIKCVSGENEVKIQNKNRFDKNTMYKKNTYIDGAGSCSTAYDASYNYYSVIFPCKPNETYTISKKSDITFRVGTLINPPQTLAQNVIGFKNLTTETKATITTSSSDNYIVISYYSNSCSNSEEELRNSIQIEEGSTATEYVAHEEQLYPISLGDIEVYENGYISIDYIEKAGYKTVTRASVTNVFEKVYGKDLNWSKSTTTIQETIYYQFFATIPQFEKQTTALNGVGKFYSNTFCLSEYTYQNRENGNFFYFSKENKVVCVAPKNVNNSYITDIDTFKESIADTYWVGKLTTPTTTEITDETLLAQLEALINAETYKNVTHIDTESESENLKPNLKLTYRKDLETMFNNINNSILSLGGNI